MPPVIAAAASFWAALTVAEAVLLVSTVILSAGTAIYGAAQARKAERQARDAANASMKDRMVTRIATEAPHRYVYGRAKVQPSPWRARRALVRCGLSPAPVHRWSRSR